MLSTIFDKPSAVALGTFDGLHKGHTAVINSTLSFAAAGGLIPCVLLFDNHPQLILTGKAPAEILPASLRIKELEKMGVRHFTVSFEEVQGLTAGEFVAEILINKLNAKAVCCGYDYRFGHDGAGDVELLKELCAKFQLELKINEAVNYKGEPVSSTRIRTAIESGDIEGANAMLGRTFSYDFEVVGGKKLGRQLGVPTINQGFPGGFVIPKHGVYVSQAVVDGCCHAAVTDIGCRPTFNECTLRSETCISEFSGDLYGQHIEVGLLKYLRPEEKFTTPQELREQITRDIQSAKEYFTASAIE